MMRTPTYLRRDHQNLAAELQLKGWVLAGFENTLDHRIWWSQVECMGTWEPTLYVGFPQQHRTRGQAIRIGWFTDTEGPSCLAQSVAEARQKIIMFLLLGPYGDYTT